MKKSSVIALQSLLVEAGQDIAIDGWFGNQTAAAIDNLEVQDWVKIAMKEVGTQEIFGVRHNDRVLEYHSVSGGYSEDEVPWCGSFVNWVFHKYGIQDTVNIPARAKSWLDFGASSIIPIVGAVGVKWRKGGGHVCFIIGKNKDGDLYCLGGNQNDEVNIRLYPKDAFIDFRVPIHFSRNHLPVYALNVNNSNKEV